MVTESGKKTKTDTRNSLCQKVWLSCQVMFIRKCSSFKDHVCYEWKCLEVKEVSVRNSPSVPAVNRWYVFSLVYTPISALTLTRLAAAAAAALGFLWDMSWCLRFIPAGSFLMPQTRVQMSKYWLAQMCVLTPRQTNRASTSVRMETGETLICFVFSYLPLVLTA